VELAGPRASAIDRPELVSAYDLLPTLCDLTGAARPPATCAAAAIYRSPPGSRCPRSSHGAPPSSVTTRTPIWPGTSATSWFCATRARGRGDLRPLRGPSRKGQPVREPAVCDRPHFAHAELASGSRATRRSGNRSLTFAARIGAANVRERLALTASRRTASGQPRPPWPCSPRRSGAGGRRGRTRPQPLGILFVARGSFKIDDAVIGAAGANPVVDRFADRLPALGRSWRPRTAAECRR